MFSRPLYHAEEEIFGPGSPSSRFREIHIWAQNHAKRSEVFITTPMSSGSFSLLDVSNMLAFFRCKKADALVICLSWVTRFCRICLRPSKTSSTTSEEHSCLFFLT